MKKTRVITMLLGVAMLLWPASAVATGLPADGSGPLAQLEAHACLPTCDETDSRFLSLAGAGLSTLGGDSISMELAASPGATELLIDIFDGDSSGQWDLGTDLLRYTLFADPAGDGAGTTVVGEWLGSEMPDNDWFAIRVPTGAEARAVSGYYFYRLFVTHTNPAGSTSSNFKVRTDGYLALDPVAFSFVSSMITMDDVQVIYPEWPALTPTTYDGTFVLYLDVAESTSYLASWDGDFDYGNAVCTDNDTDDPDTPDVGVPAWAEGTAAVPEGIATSTLDCYGVEGKTSGNPPDDNRSPMYTRPNNVVYTITDPDGNAYQNTNPSGNSEWEQFRLETDTDQPADYYLEERLPPGIYEVQASGLDLFNLNAWRFFYDIVGVCEDGNPCKPFPKPYLIGDTVWYDANGNGVQDEGEPGIPGVVVNLVDEYGYVLDTATTDENGNYYFEVDAGTHEVVVAAENFEPGGALENLSPTMPYGNERVGPVDLNYDYGYNGAGAYSAGAIGDRVWLDLDGDGVQDDGEPGLPGVTVTLTDAAGNTTVTTTDDAGIYLFDHLQPGDYTVTVDTTTLPTELLQTYDLDGLATPNTASVTLAKDEVRLDVDFGYKLPDCPACECCEKTVKLKSVSDTYIQERDTTPNGRKTALHVGWCDDKKQTLIDFDLSGIPAGATIKSASFRIYRWGGDYTGPVNIYRITNSWDEATATWNSFDGAYDDSQVWATFWASGYGWTKSVDVKDLVQGWVDGTTPEYGLLLDNPNTWGDKYFKSKEYSGGRYAPRLEITYATVCE
jgi:hypothetical protein